MKNSTTATAIAIVTGALLLGSSTMAVMGQDKPSHKNDQKAVGKMTNRSSQGGKHQTAPVKARKSDVKSVASVRVTEPQNETQGILKQSSENEPERIVGIRFERDEKSSRLAFVLSFLVPGAGQFYNGDHMKGAIQLGAFATGVTLMLTMGTESAYSTQTTQRRQEGYYGTYYYYDTQGYSEDAPSTMLYVGAGLAAASWLWSVIDAPISATNYNDERSGLRYGHMLEMGNDDHVLGVDLARHTYGTGVSVTLHF
jgi:TM2 domain-containing membrane protein YozV